jgi:hypothetical protein
MKIDSWLDGPRLAPCQHVLCTHLLLGTRLPQGLSQPYGVSLVEIHIACATCVERESSNVCLNDIRLL